MTGRALLAASLCAGCALIDGLTGDPSPAPDAAPRDGAPQPDAEPCNPCRELAGEFAVDRTRAVDILFMIDNSGSMAEEQESLATNFPRLVNTLSFLEGGLPDLHLGVISSNLGAGGHDIFACTGDGDGGELQNTPRTPGCPAPTDRYIIDEADPAGGRVRNYTGTLGDSFACIARLGTDGCGLEQPLESIRVALDGNPTNAGFLRDDAYLALVILTDEDDCSSSDPTALFDPTQSMITDPLGPLGSFRCTEFGVMCDGMTIARTPASYADCVSRGDSYLPHPSTYADFLRGIKDPALLYVSVVAGPPSPFAVGLDMAMNPQLLAACSTSTGNPVPAVRFRDFLTEFPDRASFTNLCDGDISPALDVLTSAITSLVTGSCLVGLLLDTSLAPGVQPDCKVYDVLGRGTPGELRIEIPACDAGPALPCHRFVQDAVACPFSQSNLTVDIDRDVTPPPGTVVVVECYRP